VIGMELYGDAIIANAVAAATSATPTVILD
jgi:hypothetical protein